MEIRNEIYKYYFHDAQPKALCGSYTLLTNRIVTVNKQVYNETLSLFYSHTLFSVQPREVIRCKMKVTNFSKLLHRVETTMALDFSWSPCAYRTHPMRLSLDTSNETHSIVLIHSEAVRWLAADSQRSLENWAKKYLPTTLNGTHLISTMYHCSSEYTNSIWRASMWPQKELKAFRLSSQGCTSYESDQCNIFPEIFFP